MLCSKTQPARSSWCSGVERVKAQTAATAACLDTAKSPSLTPRGLGLAAATPGKPPLHRTGTQLSQHLCLPEQNSFYRASLHVVSFFMTQWPHQLRGFVGSVLMTGQKALPTEMLGSRKSVRRNKIPLPAKYDVLLQLFGKSSC